MIKTVQIRIIAPDERTAQLAVQALVNSVGSARVALTAPRLGKWSGEYLTYGTLQVDNETTVTVEARWPPATITAPAPATGPTTRIATTGKTRKLRKP